MRAVTAADIPGLKLALEHSTKYQDQCWFSFLINMYYRQLEINRPRLKITASPTRGWNNVYTYDALYSENGREMVIQFVVWPEELPTDAVFRKNAEHALYLSGWHLTRCANAEVISEYE